jgi:hypothetical protein
VNEETIDLDDPFPDLVVATPTAFTPLGLEVLFDNECEEPTRTYPPGTLELLVRQASPHGHATVPQMIAVRRQHWNVT